MKLTLTTSESAPSALVRALRTDVSRQADVRNICLLLLGFAVVVALVPPARAYPVTDDWIYARQVTDLLQLNYRPADWAQATGLGHAAWGAIFALIFGQSFTALAVSMLVMSAACIVLLYWLLRHLGVSPAGALLGAALLGFNPIYVYLSYTFMTDVSFLAYALASLLCYVRWARGHGECWLWLGSAAASLAYLTRQVGLLPVVATLLYLWWSKKWNWREAVAIAAVPGLVAIAYSVWERTQPVPLVTFQVQSVLEGLAEAPLGYLMGRGQRIAWSLSALGLCLMPVLRLPRRPILAVPVFMLLVFFLVRGAQLYGSVFPASGNVLDHTGFVMAGYSSAIVWDERVWSILGIASAAMLSLHLAYCAERAWRWYRSGQGGSGVSFQDPAMMVYLSGLMFAGVVLALMPNLYDRYWLPVLPALMLPALRQIASVNGENANRAAGSIVARRLLVLPLALFAVVGQRDYMAHAAARWQGAETIVSRGARRNQVDAGFEWSGWHLFDEGARRVRQKPLAKYIPFPPETVLDPVYVVSDLPLQGYTRADALPYTSWLDGGQTRQVLLLRRETEQAK
jgi:4-amino-4-deoxy-L-arabinose transferase-like glycosyltransferase